MFHGSQVRSNGDNLRFVDMINELIINNACYVGSFQLCGPTAYPVQSSNWQPSCFHWTTKYVSCISGSTQSTNQRSQRKKFSIVINSRISNVQRPSEWNSSLLTMLPHKRKRSTSCCCCRSRSRSFAKDSCYLNCFYGRLLFSLRLLSFSLYQLVIRCVFLVKQLVWCAFFVKPASLVCLSRFTKTKIQEYQKYILIKPFLATVFSNRFFGF